MWKLIFLWLFQFPDACSKFKVQKLSSSEDKYLGAILLQQPLDYSIKPFYQLLLSATVSNLFKYSRYCLLVCILVWVNCSQNFQSHIFISSPDKVFVLSPSTSFSDINNTCNTNNKIILHLTIILFISKFPAVESKVLFSSLWNPTSWISLI